MSQPSLSGILIRIDRAKVHLSNFDRTVSEIQMACREAIIREHDEQRSEYIFRFGRVPSIPADLTAILGDSIHNLRVSLDYLAWQLVKATGGTPTLGQHGSTSFPILEKPLIRNQAVTYPAINPAVPEKCMKLLDEIQPYKRAKPANHDLAILNNLDIRDKHHELLIAVIGLDGPVGWWGDAEPTNFNRGPYHDRDEVLRFATPGTYGKADFNPTFRFTVRFDEPAAGVWRWDVGASVIVRNSLRYIEDEVLPRFRSFF